MILRVVTVPGDKEGERHWAAFNAEMDRPRGSTWVCDEYPDGRREFKDGYIDESFDGRVLLKDFI